MHGIKNLKPTSPKLQHIVLLMSPNISGSCGSTVWLHSGMKPVRLTKRR